MKDWMQIWIFFFVAGVIGFLIVKHTGIKPGQVKPEIVFTAFVSIFATKIVDFAYTTIKKNKEITTPKDAQKLSA